MTTTRRNAKPNIRTGTRTVVYVRISKDRENETSTTTQREECEAYAASQGWEVVALCEDIGRSGWKENVKRPGFEKALQMIEAGAVDRVLVWKLDRMVRSAVGFMRIWERIANAGGAFASKSEPWFDTSTSVGRLLIMLMATVAEMESEAKSERITPWHAYRKKHGMTPNGPTPYGYTRERNTLTIRDDQATVIRNAADEALGGTSLRSIAKRLGAEDGRTWRVRTLTHILTSPTTAGLRQIDNGAFVEGMWKPILDRSTWDALRAMLSSRTNVHAGNGVRHLLSGLMTCKCGGNLQSKTHPQGKRYTCVACLKSIHGKTADDAVEEYVLGAMNRDAWNDLRIRGRTASPDAVEALRKRFETIRKMYFDGKMDETEYEDAHAELRARIASLEESEAVDLPDVDDLRAAWPTFTVADKRLVINAVCESIIVLPHGAGATGSKRIIID